MAKPRVAVVGYGTIGTRVADGAARQGDMEFVGVVDVAPTLPIRALYEAGVPYKVFALDEGRKPAFEKAGIPIAGTLDDVLGQVDVILDTTPAGIGAKNKETYQQPGRQGHLPGRREERRRRRVLPRLRQLREGHRPELPQADLLQHDRADPRRSTRSTARSASRRSRSRSSAGSPIRATPTAGWSTRLQVEAVPNHQALDLMLIMPHVQATGLLVHTPVTHGHIINVVAKPKKSVSKEAAIDDLQEPPADPGRQDRRRLQLEHVASSSTPGTSGTSAPTCTRSASGRTASGTRATT